MPPFGRHLTLAAGWLLRASGSSGRGWKPRPCKGAARSVRVEPGEGGGHDGLYRVHAVFRLVEDYGLRALEDLVRHFERVESVLFAHFLADGRLQVVEGRQAVHEH